MYQMMNNRVYDTDQKKIIFTLSFMKDGVAEMWKQSWWKQHTAENTTFGTWEEFKDTLKKSFTPADKEGNAITKVQTASMTGKTADEFIKEFKNWQLQSGVNKDRPLIEWFLTTLLTSLQDKILQKKNPLTTLEGWYTTTSNLDNQWRKFKAISAHLRGDTDMKKKGLRLPRNESQYTPLVLLLAQLKLGSSCSRAFVEPSQARANPQWLIGSASLAELMISAHEPV